MNKHVQTRGCTAIRQNMSAINKLQVIVVTTYYLLNYLQALYPPYFNAYFINIYIKLQILIDFTNLPTLVKTQT